MRRVTWLLALVVAFVLAARLYPAFRRGFMHAEYHVTVFNRDPTELVEGLLRINESSYTLRKLGAGQAVTFDVPVRHDGHYFVRASWEDGSALVDSVGYVTNGISEYDTLEARSSGLALRNGSPKSGY